MKKSNKTNFFNKLRNIILDPQDLFNLIKKEKQKKDIFNYLIIFVFLSIISNTLFLLPNLTKYNLSLSPIKFTFFITVLILAVFTTTIILTFTLFLIGIFYHLLIKIFNGKKDINQSLKILYCITPLLLVSIIPFNGSFKILFYSLFVFAFVDTLHLKYIYLKKFQKLSTDNSIAIILISVCFELMTLFLCYKISMLI
jgi:Yip1-like protein